MKKAVSITCTFEGAAGAKIKKFLGSVGESARQLGLEGSAQLAADAVRIIAAGSSEAVESLLEMIHKEGLKVGGGAIEVEPFIKDKDYRGIFRIIE